MLIIFFRKQKYAFYYKEGVTILQMVFQKRKSMSIRCDDFENCHTFRAVFRSKSCTFVPRYDYTWNDAIHGSGADAAAHGEATVAARTTRSE